MAAGGAGIRSCIAGVSRWKGLGVRVVATSGSACGCGTCDRECFEVSVAMSGSVIETFRATDAGSGRVGEVVLNVPSVALGTSGDDMG